MTEPAPVSIARRALDRLGELTTCVADANDALDLALADAAEEVGQSDLARRLGISRKTVTKRIARHRERAA